MSEVITDYGFLAGICAHDGTDWQKLKVDSEGRLEVSVVAGHEYVDRGDPTDWDFTHADLNMDNNWYDLDLSGIITDSDAVLVHLRAVIKDASVDARLQFRENGNVNAYNVATLGTQIANVNMWGDLWVALDENLVIEYLATEVLDVVYGLVRGWLRPAA